MNNEARKILQTLGLSKEEAAVYLAGLELGGSSVQNLAKKAGIKRSTTYKILENLLEKGMFHQALKGKKRFFNAENPESLKAALKKKELELEKIMPELQSIYNVSDIKPKVKFYEGLAGAIAVYEDSLNSTERGGEILSYASIRKIFSTFPKSYAEEYFQKRVEKNITAKVIAVDCEESQEWKRNSVREMRQIFLVSEYQNIFSGDAEIYGDKIALISYKENFMAVVIESKEIANMQRFIFNLAWENLKKPKAFDKENKSEENSKNDEKDGYWSVKD